MERSERQKATSQQYDFGCRRISFCIWRSWSKFIILYYDSSHSHYKKKKERTFI